MPGASSVRSSTTISQVARLVMHSRLRRRGGISHRFAFARTLAWRVHRSRLHIWTEGGDALTALRVESRSGAGGLVLCKRPLSDGLACWTSNSGYGSIARARCDTPRVIAPTLRGTAPCAEIRGATLRLRRIGPAPRPSPIAPPQCACPCKAPVNTAAMATPVRTRPTSGSDCTSGWRRIISGSRSDRAI